LTRKNVTEVSGFEILEKNNQPKLSNAIDKVREEQSKQSTKNVDRKYQPMTLVVGQGTAKVTNRLNGL